MWLWYILRICSILFYMYWELYTCINYIIYDPAGNQALNMESNQLLSRRWLTVEPVIFFAEAIQGFLINLRTQYIEYRLATERNFTIPNVGTANSTCWLNETNSTSSEIQQEIEAETAIWILYMKDTSLFIPIITGKSWCCMTYCCQVQWLEPSPLALQNLGGNTRW